MKFQKNYRYALIICLFAGRFEPVFADTTNLFAVADTALRETNPDNNLGGLPFVPAGNSSVNERNRALFKFELVGRIPTNATVNSATLNLIVTQGPIGSHNFNLHRLLLNWGESDNIGGPDGGGNLGSPADPSEATWNARLQSSALWGAGGAAAGTDYVSNPSATRLVGTAITTNAFSSALMTADVQSWLSNPGTNFGWILIIADESSSSTARRIGSSEDPLHAPALTISYTLSTSAAQPPNIFGVGLVGYTFHFSFNAESNRSYAVEFKDSLNTNNWGIITNVPAQFVETTVGITNIISSNERYFRVGIP